jgi:hypothetical protein
VVDRARARQILGVDREASTVEVEGAFRRLAGRVHPDRGGDPERFAEIVAARRALAEPPGARAPVQVVADAGIAERLVRWVRSVRWRRTSRPRRVI